MQEKKAGKKGTRPADTEKKRPACERDGKSRSYFTGGAAKRLVRNAVSYLAGILTLGVAYPFMFCWKFRCEAASTVLDGRRLIFDGKGGALLGRYMLWILLSVVTLGVYFLFWMPLNLDRFKAAHTHFAGEEGDSFFDGRIGQFIAVNLLTKLVDVVTLGIGCFWTHCYRERWYAKCTVYDGHRLFFDGKGWQYFGKRAVWSLLCIVTLGIFAIWQAVKQKGWTISHTHVCDEAVSK